MYFKKWMAEGDAGGKECLDDTNRQKVEDRRSQLTYSQALTLDSLVAHK
jgi:hypothetical protein